jgi:hypothetical protein
MQEPIDDALGNNLPTPPLSMSGSQVDRWFSGADVSTPIDVDLFIGSPLHLSQDDAWLDDINEANLMLLFDGGVGVAVGEEEEVPQVAIVQEVNILIYLILSDLKSCL